MFINDFEFGYGRCDCCNTLFVEGDKVFQLDDDYICQKCLYAYDEPNHFTMHIAADNRLYRVVDEDNISLMSDGVYVLKKMNNNLVVSNKLYNDIRHQIQTLTDTDNYVLEKNQSGCIIRFPKSLMIHKYGFDPNCKEYEELTMIADSLKLLRPTLNYLCEGDNVIGIANIGYPSVTKIKDFEAYRSHYQRHDKEYFEELQLNPPVSYKVAKVLCYIRPVDMLRYFDERLIGQKSETKKIAYTFFEYLRSVAEGKDFTAPNWILTAPSGCGKTEVYRIIRDFCKEYGIPIPVVQVDLSLFTEAGYKGKEVSEIVKQIVEANNKTDGSAICFLDEADKKFIPSISNNGDFNSALQSNLLTLVEGSEQTVEACSDKKEYTIDTTKTMFVFMGAFQDIRDKKQQKLEQKGTIGFGSSIEKKKRTNHVDDCFYEDISLDDMLEVGMLQELAGRVEQVINLHKLSEKDMLYLLEEKAKAISNELGVQVELTSKAKKSLLEICYSSLGIRRPMNCIRSLAKETLTEAYFNDNFNKDSIKIIIHSSETAELLPVEASVSYQTFCKGEVI